MKIAEYSRQHDGTIIGTYANGYKFEGYDDGHGNPVSGTIITDSGEKYLFPDLEGEDILSVMEKIKQGEMESFKIKFKNETD